MSDAAAGSAAVVAKGSQEELGDEMGPHPVSEGMGCQPEAHEAEQLPVGKPADGSPA